MSWAAGDRSSIVALCIVGGDCALASGWMLFDVHAARHYAAFVFPLLAVSVPLLGLWWSFGRWTWKGSPFIALAILSLPLCFVSLLAIDPTTWEMHNATKPDGAWQILKLLVAVSFILMSLMARKTIDRSIMLFGFLYGLVGPVIRLGCGQSPALGRPFCPTVFATDIRAAVSALAFAALLALASMVFSRE